MKLRLISDLHLDVNARVPFELKDRDTFTLVAGDVAGDPYLAVKWLKENVHNGIAVAGNHIVYNRLNMPIEDIRELFAREMPPDAGLAYLDCLTKDKVFFKELNGILFIGSTLYTDYGSKFDHETCKPRPQTNLVRYNMEQGYWSLNDFRWGRTRENVKSDGSAGSLLPQHCLNWFRDTLLAFDAKLNEIERERPDMPVVVITHHCPSTGCIAPVYHGSPLNSSFVSDLDWFIKKHSSIRLWHCGHVHSRFQFKVGGCLVVVNPRGYCRMSEDTDWNSELAVDTDTWEVIE